MTLEPHALAAVLLSIGALILFSRNAIPLEYSCIAILISIVLLFEVFPLESAVQVSS